MNSKREAGFAAARLFDELLDGEVDGDIHTGIGTGSTSAEFMSALFIDSSRFNFICVPTSLQAEDLIRRKATITLKSLNDLHQSDGLDYLVDGADELYIEEGTKKVYMIKGGGGAMTSEKMVAYAARTRIYVVDESKISKLGLGERGLPIPVEVFPSARNFLLNSLKNALPKTFVKDIKIRYSTSGKAGPVITDHGNAIIDIYPTAVFDPVQISSIIDGIPGIVGHGLFTFPVHYVVIGKQDGGAEVIKCI